ncbi:hypothetical protein LCGC14_2998100, partial [marine sediment metagenome]
YLERIAQMATAPTLPCLFIVADSDGDSDVSVLYFGPVPTDGAGVIELLKEHGG